MYLRHLIFYRLYDYTLSLHSYANFIFHLLNLVHLPLWLGGVGQSVTGDPFAPAYMITMPSARKRADYPFIVQGSTAARQRAATRGGASQAQCGSEPR